VTSATHRRAAPARVECVDWGWRYAGRSAWALRGVSLSIQPGERVLLLGASGSGKSTLLQSIAGVLSQADGGEATGTIHLSASQAPDTEPRVGMVLQDPESQVLLARVGDDAAFGCENLGVAPAEIHERVRDALAAVDLNVPHDAPTSSLSGGQKQRLALAGVLAMQPGLLLLDEPTAMLDPRGIQELHRAVAERIRDRRTTLVIVEHRVEAWLELIDRVVVLGQQGSVVADGHPDTVFREHGALLEAMGVWLPNTYPQVRLNRVEAPAEPLLLADALEVGWSAHAPLGAPRHLALTSGRILALTGPNGAGKSALALTLAGLMPALSGQVSAAPIADGGSPHPQDWRSSELAQRIGVVFQSPDHEFVRHTVEAELAVGLEHTELTREQRRTRVLALADQLGLHHLLQANPFTLSGGEKRRLSVACALAAQPRVVILDEPTFGQDARTWTALVELMASLRDEGCALLIVTHDDLLLHTLADASLELDALAGSGEERSDDYPAAVGITLLPDSPETRLDRINPLAKIGAATVISVGLILSLDWVSAGVALVLEVAAMLSFGLSARRLLRVTTPLLIAAVLTALTIALYGRTSGDVFVEFLLIRVSEGSLTLAFATLLRVLAIALPAVVLLSTIRPTQLADALEQHTPLPPRFILGALVALRQLESLSSDWQTLTRSRRARGVGDGLALVRFWSQAFALFVLAIRRADALSVAMHVRGFSEHGQRTWTRTSVLGWRDWVFLAGAAGLVAVAVAVAVAMGSWNLVLGGVGG